MKKFLAAVVAVMMAFTLILPAMAEGGLTAEILPEEAADLNEALNVPGGALNFVSEGTYPWVVEEDWAKSTNEGIGSSESTVSTTVTVVEGDIVQFDFISGGEGSQPTYDWDNLKFKVDGVEVIHWALHNEWETYSQALEEGEHTLSWTYKKDGSVNPPIDVAKLDNVYVGAPVEPNAINVEDLTVAGNRYAQLVWEVLPAAAFDKSVTFAIADEAIATIDENGVVTGVAAGETTVTVTSVAVPEVSGTATITVTEALPELTLDYVLNVEGGELHFVSEGDYPWVIPETAPAGQEYAKSSNEGVSGSSSTITAAVTANEGDILRFDFQCWGEGSYYLYDKLQLKIDDAVIIEWGAGPKEWTTYTTALTAGEHNIEWTYSKDGSGNMEGDHAFLDNVYVGQPPLPEEIQVDPVEVPVGRHATAVYTVLPEDTFDKSVTFATADEAIATVDENGVVIGVAEGETNLIVTSVADPTVSGTAVITVTPELPTVWLNGFMAYDPQGTSGIWGQFADYDPSVVENKGAMETTFAGAFAGGKVYGYTYDPNAGSGDFYIMDPANGYTVSYPGYNPGIGVFAMAYNHANDKMYAFCPSPTDPDNGRALYEVNLAVGSLEYVADLDAGGESIMTLAIATDGTAYGLTYGDENFGDNTAELYTINLETGVCTLVGTTGLGLAYVQSMTWDHNTNQLFWAQYASDGSSGLYTVDVTTGAATLLGTIGSGAEVTGLFTVDTLAIPPVVMPDCAISFMDGATGEEIEGGYTVEAGTVLDPADFPEPPAHPPLEFTGWDYDGHAVYTDTVVTALYEDPDAIGFYFETDPAVDGWTWEDHDGDGYNWQWSLADSGHNYTSPEGEGCMISFSYDNDTWMALTPDNWLISPEVPGGGTVSFILCAQDGGYADEHIGVYASADGGETWSEELGYFAPKAAGPNFTFTVFLAEYAGMNIKLAFRHYDSSDQFCVNLDAVVVSRGAEPTPPPAEIIGYYFETDPAADGWTWEDQDGDGNNWLWNTEFSAIEGTGCMLSHSYGAGGDLTPDNWLISPTVPGGTEVNFFIATTYDWYVLDPVGVYVSTDDGATWSEELGYFEATAAPQVCNVDLSAYAGQDIKIAFRHYDVTGGWELQLDKVLVGHPAPPTEIIVQDVSVPVGRKAKVNYTVLPEDILNKNVTFTIADETIATVDEFGKVTGVAEGVTEITVASVVAPEIFGTATVTVTPELPTTWLNGYIAFDPVTGMTGVWGQFGDADPSVVEEMGPMLDTFGGAFAGGKVYGYLQSGDFYITDVTEAPYTTVYPGTKADVLVYAMAYDHANDVMYAFAQDPNTYATNIYTVDLAIGTLTYVTPILSGEEMIFTLAIDGEGNAYGINSGDDARLWNVDLATGECTLIGSTGHALYYVQGMTWDFDSDMIYWAQYCDDANNGLCIVNPATGETSECGAIGGAAEVTALWIRNDLEIPEIVMPDFDISFMDGFTGEEIEGGYTVEGGTVLDPEDFPTPPEHAGLEFTGWDYDGHAIYADTVITAKYRDPNAMGWYFEAADGDPTTYGWTMKDEDGDGNNWRWLTADNWSPDWGYPEGQGCMNSESYVNYVGPLTPDNWLISPEVPGGGTVSFILCAQDGGYADEKIGVYASADGGETWSEELGYFIPKDPGPNFTFTVDLAEFAGMNIKLAFRHYDSSDAFSVNLDAVEVEPAKVLPEEITVEDIVVYEGQTADAVYTVLPEEAEDKTVTFAIADETIATVDENGVVTGVAAGETEITVTSIANPEISGTAAVTVIPYEPEEGDIIFDIRNPGTEDGLYYALPGETVAVNLTVTGEYAAHGVDIWLDYDPEMLTVDHTEKGPVLTENAAEIGATVILNSDTVPGSIRLGIACPDAPLTQEGIVYTVYFTVGEAVPMDTVIPLTVAVQEFVNMPVGEETTPIPWFAYNSGVVVAVPPAPPATGFASLAGIGIASILAGAGVVLFRRKRN